MNRTAWMAAILAMALAACGGAETISTAPAPGPSPTTTLATPRPDPLAELEAARARWEAVGLTTYQLEFTDDCGECGPELTAPREAVVWDGDLIDPSGGVLSVEAMFSRIEQASAAGQAVDVTYHQDLGYPTEVWIDREARAYDGGIHWLVDDVRAGLPGSSASLDELVAARGRWREARPPAYEYRVTFVCDCPFAGYMWTQVDGNRVTDWDIDLVEPDRTGASPVTVDELFDDLEEIFRLGSVEDSGVVFAATAEFDPTLGFPRWIGLDIEVIDPSSELAILSPRLVFAIDRFQPIDPPTSMAVELEDARLAWARWGSLDYRYELSALDVSGDLNLNEDGSLKDPYVVTVKDGRVSGVTRAGIAVDDYEPLIYPIAQLFDAIALWQQGGSQTDVLYHDTLGYPILVSVRDANEIRQFFTIRNLEPL